MQGAPNLVCPDPVVLDTLIFDGKEVAVVSTAKLLGLTISAKLTWNGTSKKWLRKLESDCIS